MSRLSLQASAAVTVGAALTVICPATQCDQLGAAPGEVMILCTRTNNDPSRTLNEQLEGAESSSGPWSVQTSADLQNIAPGETRQRFIPITGMRWIRTTGTASGAGALSVTSTTSLALA